MTFYDTIDEILSMINSNLEYPIPIVMGLQNSNYIDVELLNNDLDVILKNKIPNTNDLSVVFIDNKDNKVVCQSYDSLCKYESNNRKNLIHDYLKSFEPIGKTTDKKYDLYLYLLPDEIENTIDGITYKNNDIQLPDFQHFKYQNLYTYQDEDKFINAILIEFIVRNARSNNLLLDMLTLEESYLDGETDEEYELRIMKLLQEKENQIDNILLQNYGLDAYEIRQLDLTIYKSVDIRDEQDMSIELSTFDPIHKNIILDPRLPEEEYLEKAKYLKDQYEKEKNNYFPLKERLNDKYLKEVTMIINKFPKSFQKKQDDLIKALFIFDYIEARKKIIEQLNMSEYKKYENMKKELKKYDILPIDYKIELQNMNEELNEALLKPPKMDPKYKDSIFHEVASILDEKAGQCKKLYNHIHKFIKKKLPIPNLY